MVLLKRTFFESQFIFQVSWYCHVYLWMYHGTSLWSSEGILLQR